VSIVYLIDFYILDVSNEQFWCVEVIKNFELGNFKNIRLPIHCDEGPYRFASTSLDNFFDFTSDLVSFYKNNNITPVIESDFSSSEKLDSVYSFLEN